MCSVPSVVHGLVRVCSQEMPHNAIPFRSISPTDPLTMFGGYAEGDAPVRSGGGVPVNQQAMVAPDAFHLHLMAGSGAVVVGCTGQDLIDLQQLPDKR